MWERGPISEPDNGGLDRPPFLLGAAPELVSRLYLEEKKVLGNGNYTRANPICVCCRWNSKPLVIVRVCVCAGADERQWWTVDPGRIKSQATSALSCLSFCRKLFSCKKDILNGLCCKAVSPIAVSLGFLKGKKVASIFFGFNGLLRRRYWERATCTGVLLRPWSCRMSETCRAVEARVSQTLTFLWLWVLPLSEGSL